MKSTSNATKDILGAFYQQGKNNCATIGIIKLAMATFGMDHLFKTIAEDANGSTNVTLKNNVTITISAQELAKLSKESGFTLNEGDDEQNKKQILRFAHLCFCVVVKYYMQIEEIDLTQALREINVKGINSDYAYLNLGFTADDVKFLTEENEGTRDASIYIGNEAYLLYNNNHCVMASFDVYDSYGEIEEVSSFAKSHSSILKPGKTCWAYVLLKKE
jgi:hypothetical protein